ncbi:olfactory receptor 49-like [Nannospalax galili]|uniref:olfactory receptor 49-like n=1 Tax=Nannospalax galili TaxID=1026970 RepID=UPI0004ED2CE7|nr:olfactory receptor 49-like [Nannospalax galili]XP_008825992.1 olfactory receptor 49-like [Nannospalax galili]
MEPRTPSPGVNLTSVLEFVLLGVTNRRDLQLLLFAVLLVTYLLTLLGNLTIITLTLADRRLHTPMYYFLRHFSLLEVGFTSTVSPQMLTHLLTARRTISRNCCFAQMMLYFTLGAVETLLLAVMSTDRFLAICRPLRYPALMTPHVCSALVLACWLASLLVLPGLFAWMLSLPFCGPHVLNHFFCDSSPLLELVCADTRRLQLVAFLVAVCTLLVATLVTAMSYACIIISIVRLPAAGGRGKAFSTCSAHLLVVSLSYGSCIFMYLNPTQTGRVDANKGVAFFNTTVSPLLNPFIYCLRNQLVHKVGRDLLLRGREISSKVSRL